MAKNATPKELAQKAKDAHDAGRTRFTARIELPYSHSTTEVDECSAFVEAIEVVGWEADHFSVAGQVGSEDCAYVLFKQR